MNTKKQALDLITQAAIPLHLCVDVHAIVAFGALDHFLRRQEGQQRVIGTVLGRIDDKTKAVTVTNSFAVPCEEGADGTIAVGQDYQEKMARLLARVNPEEEVVGWYATPGADGKLTDDASEMIHGFYGQACAGSARAGMQIHLRPHHATTERLDADRQAILATQEHTLASSAAPDALLWAILLPIN